MRVFHFMSHLSFVNSLDVMYIFSACQLLPNHILTQVGRHDDGLPITNMVISPDKSCLLSCSENVVNFWELNDVYRERCRRDGVVSKLCEGKDEELSANSASDEEPPKRKKRKSKRKQKNSLSTRESQNCVADFFSDL